MRRHCGRPGCSALATVTFSFDAAQCVVWLNPISDGAPRAGDLCTRHADAMAPPKGWDRIDRRPHSEPVAKQPATPRPSPPSTPTLPTNAGVPLQTRPADASASALQGGSLVPTDWATPLETPQGVPPENGAALNPPNPASAPASAPVNTPAKTSRAARTVVPSAVGDDLLPHKPPVKRKRRNRWDEVPSLFGDAQVEVNEVVSNDGDATDSEKADTARPLPGDGPTDVSTDVPAVSVTQAEVPWLPRFATDDDLGRVLDASTPLLARAFRNARPMETESEAASGEPEIGDDDEAF